MADDKLSPTVVENITSAANVKSVGENIQGKVGQSLIGFKGLAQAGSKESRPVLRILQGVKDLQVRTVDKISEVWEVLKAQLDLEKDAERRERAKDIPLKTGGSDPTPTGGDIQEEEAKKGGLLSSGEKILAMLGITGAATAVAIGAALFAGVTALLLGLVKAITDGFKGAEVFGGVPGFIGGFFGGMESGIKGMFTGMGKFAAIGVGIGMLAGPPGMIIGGLLGALIGGILGFIGGERITAFINKAIELPQQMFQAVIDKFVMMKEWVVDVISGFPEKIAEMANTLFDPIIWVVRKIQNGFKHMVNFYIDMVNKLLPEKWHIKKLEIDPVGGIGDERREKETKAATEKALAKVQSAEGPEKGTALNADEQKKMIATAEKFLSTNMDDLKNTLKDKNATGAYMESLNNLTLMAKEGAFGDKSEELLSRLLKHQETIKVTAAEGAAELRALDEEVPEHMTAIELGKTSGFDETKIVDQDKADKTKDNIARLETEMKNAIQSGEGKETIVNIQKDIDQEKKSLKKIEGEDEKGWFGKALATVLPGGDEGYSEGGMYKNFFKKFTSKKGALVSDSSSDGVPIVVTNVSNNNSSSTKKNMAVSSSTLHMTTRNNDFLYQDI